MDKQLLLKILHMSKEQTIISKNKLLESFNKERVKMFFQQLENNHFVFQPTLDNNYKISPQQRADLAIYGATHGIDFEWLIKELTWQEFEILTTSVGEEFGYEGMKGLNFSTSKQKYQIDVVLKKQPYIFFIDCKHYSLTGKKSVLRNAAKEQAARVQALTNNRDILQEKVGLTNWEKAVLIPLVVTWLDDEIFFHQKIPVIPFMNLRSFFRNFYLYFPDLRKITYKFATD
ncbi:MAG: hypothetical protein U9O98_11570 [Asgard group archaeon]|nr:hypothetical protein [Asgard group archaeon]